MAGRRDVEIKVKVDDAQAKSKLKGIGDEADKSGKKFGGMGGAAGILKGGLIGLAASGAVDFLKEAGENALADVKAQEQLALAVQNSTGATDAQADAVADYIDKTQMATGITDDQLRPAFANLVRATKDVEEAQRIMTTAMDISTATGKPLEAVTLSLAKAYQGNVSSLGRLGLKVRDTEGDYLDFDEALQAANDSMGGATAAAADSVEGKMKRLSIAVDEAKEGFGEMILLPVAEWVADLFEAFQKEGDQNFLDAVVTDLKALGDETQNAKENPALQGLIDWFKDLDENMSIFEGAATRYGDRMGDVTQTTKHSRGALEEIIPVLEDTAGAARQVGDDVDYSTDKFYEHTDAVRAATDPVFALAEAERSQAEAIADATAKAEEYGEGSPEHLDALGKVKDAAYDVQDAEKAMGSQSGTTRSTMEAHLRSLRVYTEDQIGLMLDEFDRINAYKFQAKTIAVTHKVTGGGVQEFQTGGIVPGSRGAPQMAIVHGGEEILQPHRAGRGGSGTVNNITIHAGLGSDPNAISKALVESLQRYQRANGSIPIKTRS